MDLRTTAFCTLLLLALGTGPSGVFAQPRRNGPLGPRPPFSDGVNGTLDGDNGTFPLPCNASGLLPPSGNDTAPGNGTRPDHPPFPCNGTLPPFNGTFPPLNGSFYGPGDGPFGPGGRHGGPRGGGGRPPCGNGTHPLNGTHSNLNTTLGHLNSTFGPCNGTGPDGGPFGPRPDGPNGNGTHGEGGPGFEGFHGGPPNGTLNGTAVNCTAAGGNSTSSSSSGFFERILRFFGLGGSSKKGQQGGHACNGTVNGTAVNGTILPFVGPPQNFSRGAFPPADAPGLPPAGSALLNADAPFPEGQTDDQGLPPLPADWDMHSGAAGGPEVPPRFPHGRMPFRGGAA